MENASPNPDLRQLNFTLGHQGIGWKRSRASRGIMQKAAPETVHEFLGNFFVVREKTVPRIKSHPNETRGRWTRTKKYLLNQSPLICLQLVIHQIMHKQTPIRTTTSWYHPRHSHSWFSHLWNIFSHGSPSAKRYLPGSDILHPYGLVQKRAITTNLIPKGESGPKRGLMVTVPRSMDSRCSTFFDVLN